MVFDQTDLMTPYMIDQALQLVAQFDAGVFDEEINNIVELFNAIRLVDSVSPLELSGEYGAEALRRPLAAVRQVVGRFIGKIDDENFSRTISGIERFYCGDLLLFLVKYGVIKKLSARTVIDGLVGAGLTVEELLSSSSLVQYCDAELRQLLVSDVEGAEIVIRHWLEKNSGRGIFLPRSLSGDDQNRLLWRFVNSSDPHPNVLELISKARDGGSLGIDRRVRKVAGRKHEAAVREILEGENVVKFSTRISFDPELSSDVAVKFDRDDFGVTFSTAWLTENLDFPTVCNNLIHVFGIIDRRGLLMAPARRGDVGVLEESLLTSGLEFYPTGSGFRLRQGLASGIFTVYEEILNQNGIRLEEVLKWFFETYLLQEFGVENFTFNCTTPGSSSIEKNRHLFPEMERILDQFCLLLQDGEIDDELLSLGDSGLDMGNIGSLLSDKYLYPKSGREVESVMHLLFSDQSPLSYLNRDVNAESFFELLVSEKVDAGSLHEFQRRDIDFLTDLGLLTTEDRVVKAVCPELLLILRGVYRDGVLSLWHYPSAFREFANSLVERGWCEYQSKLLARLEVDYFDYCMNGRQFTNGLKLRNRYAHSSWSSMQGEDVHRANYIKVLELLASLMLKINDELCIRAAYGLDVEGV